MRLPGLCGRTQDGAAAPEVVVLVEAAEVGRHDEDALANALRAQSVVAQALTVAVRERRRVDVQATALGHVVVHELREAIRVVADGATDRAPRGVEDEGLIAARRPVGLGRRQVHLVVVAGKPLGREDREAVVDGVGLLGILDRHAHNHVQAEFLGKLGDLIGRGARDGLGELVLHLFLERLFGLVIVGGERHLGEHHEVGAFLLCRLHVAQDPVEVLFLLAPHGSERYGRHSDDVLVHFDAPFVGDCRDDHAARVCFTPRVAHRAARSQRVFTASRERNQPARESIPARNARGWDKRDGGFRPKL